MTVGIAIGYGVVLIGSYLLALVHRRQCRVRIRGLERKHHARLFVFQATVLYFSWCASSFTLVLLPTLGISAWLNVPLSFAYPVEAVGTIIASTYLLGEIAIQKDGEF